jgi:nucleoid DNA-binding protein
MAKMTKNQLIDAIAERTQVSKGDVKAVIEQMQRKHPVKTVYRSLSAQAA